MPYISTHATMEGIKDIVITRKGGQNLLKMRFLVVRHDVIDDEPVRVVYSVHNMNELQRGTGPGLNVNCRGKATVDAAIQDWVDRAWKGCPWDYTGESGEWVTVHSSN